MAKLRTEVVAASLLTSWTDSDTAMQIIGSSLGVFGPDVLDATTVLSTETPLRNALFDILLSLVEGGALDMRPVGDGRYAFRWRQDAAVAALSPEGATVIDLAVPSPHTVELAVARAERDAALGRAEVAEALAAERERLLLLASAQTPSEPPPSAEPDHESSEVVYLTPPAPTPKPKPRQAKPKPKPRQATPAKPPRAKARPVKATPVKAVPVEPAAVEPAPAEPAPAEPAPAEPAPAEPEPIEAILIDEPAPTEAAPAGPAPVEPAPVKAVRKRKAPRVKSPKAKPPVVAEAAPSEPVEDADETGHAPLPMWSGYAIDKSRPHLSSVDRLADEG